MYDDSQSSKEGQKVSVQLKCWLEASPKEQPWNGIRSASGSSLRKIHSEDRKEGIDGAAAEPVDIKSDKFDK